MLSPKTQYNLKNAKETSRSTFALANEKFSKRHLEIDQKTSELLARKPAKAAGNVAAIRENIAHNERARRMRDISASKLRELWGSQLLESEKQALATGIGVARETPLAVGQSSASESLGWAEEHLFDRRSVVREHELWRHALEHSRGLRSRCREVEGNKRCPRFSTGTVTNRRRSQRARRWGASGTC